MRLGRRPMVDRRTVPITDQVSARRDEISELQLRFKLLDARYTNDIKRLIAIEESGQFFRIASQWLPTLYIWGDQPFGDGVKQTLNATVQVVTRNGFHTFAVIPKRWVVERSFAWLEKNRRLWTNCERRLNTNLQFVHLAFLVLLLKRS